jgi:chemotaxis protein CheC
MLNKVIAEQDRFSKHDRKRVIEAKAAKIEEIKIDLDEDISHPSASGLQEGSSGKKGTSAGAERTATGAPGAEAAGIDKEAGKFEKTRVSEKGTGRPRGGSPTVDSTASASMAEDTDDGEIRQRIHKTLDDFRHELRESIKSTVSEGEPSEHMASALDLSQQDLDEFRLVANMGATNAAESLSKILNKRIDLSIPDVTIKPIEQIPKYIGNIDSIYIGIMMPILGDTEGTILFIFKEGIGFEIVDLLYGMTLRKTKELNEEGESALQELTNIVGSSVINVFGEKTGLVLRPGLPTMVHDFLQSVIDSILVVHNLQNDYAIVMDTAFYFENDQIIGNLILLMDGDSLKHIVQRMRSHGGSN